MTSTWGKTTRRGRSSCRDGRRGTCRSVRTTRATIRRCWRARGFTRPMLRMASMAEAIAAGGLHARVVVESRDEIGKLGDAFNRMTEELAHSHAILEDRVKQRTEELGRVIGTLRQSQEH